MKRFLLLTLSGSAIVALSACGGSSTAPTTSPPVSLPAKTVSGTTPTAYDAAAGTLILNGAPVTNPRLTELVTNGQVAVFANAGNGTYTAIAQNSDVFGVAAAEDVGGTDLRGFNFGRLGATEFPTTGAATFTGDYAGTFIADAIAVGSQNVFRIVDGDVALSADFAGDTVTGSITNRRGYSDAGVLSATDTYADAMITDGTIAADGSFAATVTGGARDGYTFTDGRTIGIFGGATGNAAAGVVTINQILDGTVLGRTEIGAFVATQD